MAQNDIESSTMSVRLSQKTKAELDKLAASTGRTRSYLAARAIAEYVELNRWQVEGIEAAIREADAGAPLVEHEPVAAWLQSWEGDDDVPPPRA